MKYTLTIHPSYRLISPHPLLSGAINILRTGGSLAFLTLQSAPLMQTSTEPVAELLLPSYPAVPLQPVNH